MDGDPRQRQGGEKGDQGLPPPTRACPLLLLPYSLLTTAGHLTPIHGEAELCPGCSSWCPAELASGIKAPEECGHSHHEQGVDVDHTGPARVLADVLQLPGCCSRLFLGRGWGTTRPTPTHSTEPEQAPAEQAWCWGLGL